MQRLLSAGGHSTSIHGSLLSLASAISEQVGAILLTEEAVGDGRLELQAALSLQEAWSDIPIILLAARAAGAVGSSETARLRLSSLAANLVVLERPMSAVSLLSAVASAMQGRRRQFELRDQLRKLASSEQALAASERELRIITDSLPVLISFIGCDGVYRFINQSSYGWFYQAPEEIIGRKIESVLGADGFASRKPWIDRALAGEAVEFELDWPHRDGKRRDAEIRYIPRITSDGRVDGFHVFVLDITQRKLASEALQRATETLEERVAVRTAELHLEMANRERMEAELRQSQKMESLGQLTGGIAHDFNNMMTGVIGALEIMVRRIDSGRTNDLHRFMEAAITSAKRASSLTQRLLAFSRRQSLDPQAVDLNALVMSLNELLARSLTERVTLVIEASDDPVWVWTDANQLQNAILNLALNARDAMPDGGKLTISTAATDVGVDTKSGNVVLQPGRYGVVHVVDQGVGMPDDVLEKMFEPFFTTKPQGQGTGLGLSMVYGFARQSHGDVLVESEVGRGTAISVYLPASNSAEVVDNSDRRFTPEGSGETVLLVEDDDSVRLLVRELLVELGYRPIEASEGLAASEILASGK
ncbi:MAG: PAS domain-containing sensor histidine kinase [Hyphomicrobiales bacterium]|nr:MAG: PAS domain-containing sensor histidine kinase [Hyphomicrobiales bacterium]